MFDDQFGEWFLTTELEELRKKTKEGRVPWEQAPGKNHYTLIVHLAEKDKIVYLEKQTSGAYIFGLGWITELGLKHTGNLKYPQATYRFDFQEHIGNGRRSLYQKCEWLYRDAREVANHRQATKSHTREQLQEAVASL